MQYSFLVKSIILLYLLHTKIDAGFTYVNNIPHQLFSIYFIFRLIIYVIRTDMYQNNIRLIPFESLVTRIYLMIQAPRKTLKYVFSSKPIFEKDILFFFFILFRWSPMINFFSKLGCFRMSMFSYPVLCVCVFLLFVFFFPLVMQASGCLLCFDFFFCLRLLGAS